MTSILLFILIFNILYSIFLHIEPTHTTIFNYLYNISYGIPFLIASLTSLYLIAKCKQHRFINGFLGLGSLFFFIAQLIWAYYNLFLNTEIPYPGISDLFWQLFYPFTIIGGFLVMKDIKINFGFGKISELLLTFFILFGILYAFMSQSIAPSDSPLIQFLNWSYPAYDALLVSMSLTALRSKIGKTEPLLLFFVLAFITLAIGDTLFAYQNTNELYWNGNSSDAIYSIAGTLYAFGIANLNKLLHSDTNKDSFSTTPTASQSI